MPSIELARWFRNTNILIMVVIIEKTKNGLHVEANISSVEEVESMAKKLAGLLPKSTSEKSLLNCGIDVNRKDSFGYCFLKGKYITPDDLKKMFP